jgi:AcrR family transcriptional regulator
MPRVSVAHEQEIRTRISVAALKVFTELGFHRATVQDIVRESGLSVGAIYTYFSGKDELFLATCDLSTGQGIGELADRLARASGLPERLAIGLGFFFDSVEAADGQSGMSTFLVQAWAVADQEPAVREMLVRRREQLMTVSGMLIREGMARGDLPAWLDVEAVSGGISALLDGLLLQRVEEGAAYRRSNAERRARSIVELLLAAAASPTRPVLPAAAPQPVVAPWMGSRGTTGLS